MKFQLVPGFAVYVRGDAYTNSATFYGPHPRWDVSQDASDGTSLGVNRSPVFWLPDTAVIP